MKQGAMKSFFGNVFVRMNEGRLTPELMYTPASAFLQFFHPPPLETGLADNGACLRKLFWPSWNPLIEFGAPPKLYTCRLVSQWNRDHFPKLVGMYEKHHVVLTCPITKWRINRSHCAVLTSRKNRIPISTDRVNLLMPVDWYLLICASCQGTEIFQLDLHAFPKPSAFKVPSTRECIVKLVAQAVRGDTVDGQNPAPPRMIIIPLFKGF